MVVKIQLHRLHWRITYHSRPHEETAVIIYLPNSSCRTDLFVEQIYFLKPHSETQYFTLFSPEWVRKWVGSLTHFLRSTFPLQKRKKKPEISRFQVFYGCGGRTRTCGLRVMSCSEAPIPCNARVLRLLSPRKSRKTRRPDEFAPRLTDELSRKWVGIWVSADSGNSRNGPLNQRRGFFFSA